MPLRRVDSSMFPTDTAAARNALQIVSDFSVQLQLADLLGDRMGFINSFADPFDDESDIDAGVTAGQIVTSGAGAGGVGNTMIDRSFAVLNNVVVNAFRVHSLVAGTGKAKILNEDSATQYDLLTEVSFTHTGSGWETFRLSVPYTTPASGTLRLAVYAGTGLQTASMPLIQRSYKGGDLAGNDQTATNDGLAWIYAAQYAHSSLSANQVYNPTTDLYSPAVVGGGLISPAGLTTLTDYNLAATVAFDAGLSHDNANSASKSTSSGSAYIGKTLLSAKRIAGGRYYPSNQSGMAGGGIANLEVQLRAKTGAAPTNFAADGVLLGTSGTIADQTGVVAITNVNDTTTAFTHWWFYLARVGGTDDQFFCSEVQVDEVAARQNMALVSNAYTALVVPKTGRLVIQGIPNEAIVLNTDLKGWISRDNGTTWSQVTLGLTIDGTAKIYEGSVSLVGQPTGTQMRWKVTTHNNKNIDVSGVVIGWTT